MELITSDMKRIVNVGTSDIWMSLTSTISTNLGYYKDRIPYAMHFLKTGECNSQNATKTAREVNLIRDELSKFATDKVVYDCSDPKKDAPWKNNISPIITSCSNFFMTADGKDLLFEIVSILTYCGIVHVDVRIL